MGESVAVREEVSRSAAQVGPRAGAWLLFYPRTTGRPKNNLRVSVY